MQMLTMYFNVPADFTFFCDVMEKFMNTNYDKVRRMVHSIYDYNDDGLVCELDIYSFIKIFEAEDP